MAVGSVSKFMASYSSLTPFLLHIKILQYSERTIAHLNLTAIREWKKCREIFVCVCMYKIYLRCVKPSHMNHVRNNPKWHTIIDSKDKVLFYTKPFSQYFGWERCSFWSHPLCMTEGFSGESQWFFSLSASRVSSRGSEHCRLLWVHLLLSTLLVQNRQYFYAAISCICKGMLWWELSNVHICMALSSVTSNHEFIRAKLPWPGVSFLFIFFFLLKRAKLFWFFSMI